MATETAKPAPAEKPAPADTEKTSAPAEFEPVKLTRNGENRTAETAAEEAKLRWDGWRSAPSGKTKN